MRSELSRVEWVDDGAGRVPVFFDSRGRLVDALHDFVVTVVASKHGSLSEAGYRSAVDAASYATLGWLRYLDSVGKQLQDANDAILEEFRNATLTRVLKAVGGKGDERVSKRTVNAQLRWIYGFYAWANGEGGKFSGVMSAQGPVTSALCDPPSSQDGKRRRREGARDFPKCYRGVSGQGGGKQHFATSEEKRRLIAALTSGESPFVRERNRLWVELTDRVGWRAGTLWGLEVDDFHHPRMTESEDGFLVTPKVQKNGYGGAFEVPATLVARVRRFMDLRAAWLKENRFPEAKTGGRLFVSSTTGRPLGPKTIVQAFGKAYREIGVPAGRGAGHHSLRRKFGDEVTVQELEARREMGLSTAPEDLMHVTARRLGQRSISSQGPYQRAVRSGTRRADAVKLREALYEMDAVIADKDVEIGLLRRQLDDRPRRKNGARRKPKGMC